MYYVLTVHWPTGKAAHMRVHQDLSQNSQWSAQPCGRDLCELKGMDTVVDIVSFVLEKWGTLVCYVSQSQYIHPI